MKLSCKNNRTARRRFLEIWRAGRPELAAGQLQYDRRFFGREVAHPDVEFHTLSSTSQFAGY